MTEPKHGRTYHRGSITRRASKNTRIIGLRELTTKAGNQRAIVGSRIHRASAPGEAPAVEHGTLINSIHTEVNGAEASIEATAPQAGILEYYKNRAVFEPELERARPRFVRDVEAAIGGLL